MGEGVAEEHLRGVAALFVNNGELHVSQHSKEDEDGGEIDVAIVEVGYRLGRYGVHDIADEHDAACHRNGFVDESKVISFRIVTGWNFGLLKFQDVVSALCKP